MGKRQESNICARKTTVVSADFSATLFITLKNTFLLANQ